MSTSTSIRNIQRFLSPSSPCPICGGYDRMKRGYGERCSGFMDADGTYAFCTREEYAGSLPQQNTSPESYKHLLNGECNCGFTHGALTTSHTSNGHKPRSKRSSSTEKRTIVTTYSYRGKQNEFLYQAVRYDPKSFGMRRPDAETGKWINNMKGFDSYVPYNLPAILTTPLDTPVYDVEGEKDVDRMTLLGLVATTNIGGAGKWSKHEDAYNPYFKGHPMVLLPDNDDAGEKHSLQVAQSLYGTAASIRIVHLPNLPPKGDVSDWLDAGGTKEELERLVSETPEYHPVAEEKAVVALVPVVNQNELAFEYMKWSIQLQAVDTKILSDRHKIVLMVLYLYMREVQQDEKGWKIDKDALGKRAGMDGKEFLECLRYLTKMLGLFRKDYSNEWYLDYSKNGTRKRCNNKILFVQPTKDFFTPAGYCILPEDERTHGGPRKKKCENCGSENTRSYVVIECLDCGHNEYPPIQDDPEPTHIVESTITVSEEETQETFFDTPKMALSKNENENEVNHPTVYNPQDGSSESSSVFAFPSNWTQSTPCETCGCGLYRDNACVRCSPPKGYLPYKETINQLYPKKAKVTAQSPPEMRINHARLDGGMWEALV